MHDDPVDSAISPARVGLSLKGVKPEEVSRGDVIATDNSVLMESEISLDFKKNPFYKEDFSENQMCLVSIGLQIKPAKFLSIDPVKLSLEKPAVFDKGDICVILKPESKSIRISLTIS